MKRKGTAKNQHKSNVVKNHTDVTTRHSRKESGINHTAQKQFCTLPIANARQSGGERSEGGKHRGVFS